MRLSYLRVAETEDCRMQLPDDDCEVVSLLFKNPA
jgi:hypothetical protein